MMFRGEDGEMREFEIISTRERESGKIIIFIFFVSVQGKRADAKSTPSYFLGPTYISIIMSLSDL